MTRDTDIFCREFGSGAVTIYFKDLGLSLPGLEFRSPEWIRCERFTSTPSKGSFNFVFDMNILSTPHILIQFWLDWFSDRNIIFCAIGLKPVYRVCIWIKMAEKLFALLQPLSRKFEFQSKTQEIKHVFSCLLRNNHPGGDMLFHIVKDEA